MVVPKPTLVVHVDEGHGGPDDRGQQRSQPADQQVYTVVGGGVVEENIDHQDVVEVESLQLYYMTGSAHLCLPLTSRNIQWNIADLLYSNIIQEN